MRSLALFFAAACVASAQPKVQMEITPGGVRYGWVGAKPGRPAPTVFFLGGAVEDNLTEPHYVEGINALGAGVWCVTVDLPGHGRDVRPNEPDGLPAWRYRLEHGDDSIAHFTRRASAVLDHFVAQKYTDSEKVGVFGTSRGGFMALHLAAADSRVRNVAGFAPVTELTALTEFQKMEKEHLARAHAVARLADRLYDRAIWIMIGSTDHRVSTQRSIEFTERIIEAAAAHGQRPRIELHIESSDGHRVPDLSYLRAGQWMRRQFGLSPIEVK